MSRFGDFVRSPTGYWLILASLLLFSSANVYGSWAEIRGLSAERSSDGLLNEARWQEWAQHHRRLFAMIRPGERIGIQLEGTKTIGILLEMTEGGLMARSEVFLAAEKPGLVVTFRPELAERLLADVSDQDPESIWKTMKTGLNERNITIWSSADLERLEVGGYLGFMRAVDTRPANHDWATIRTRLGEAMPEQGSDLSR